MRQGFYRVESVREIAGNIHLLSLHAPEIASSVRAGQFLNIKTRDYFLPLLRRPFSVYHREGDSLRIIFNVVGLGTRILASAPPGDQLDVIGPLGNAFGVRGEYDEAVLVAGGLGIAPMPMLTAELKSARKKIHTFLGARNASQIVREHMEDVSVATDDGSAGFRGTVVELLRGRLRQAPYARPKIFACGPTPMLRALAVLAEEVNIPCELSLESPMACGIGICQGCPVEVTGGPRKYALVCREGTVFDSKLVVL
ncbi:MAG TPA: dihydroorotate dehydrogenase electron transfer subunit [Bacteroidota bacterium]|nr:dihydroorotate dehydrogenase electron transfer subunit [Bacteroidota bacterium]